MPKASRSVSEKINLLWSLGDWQALLEQDVSVIDDRPDRDRLLYLLIHAASIRGSHHRVHDLLHLSRKWKLSHEAVSLALLSGMDMVVARKHAILGQTGEARAAILRSMQLMIGDEILENLVDLRLLDITLQAETLLEPHRSDLAATFPVAVDTPPAIIARDHVGQALAEFPVNNADGQGGFALAEAEGRVFCGYYDDSKNMVIARRNLDGSWDRVTLEQSILWDSHNYVALALDETGMLHVCGNMHVSPLVYFRSRAPFDIFSLQPVSAMVGTRENRVTYPRFFSTPEGRLCFSYRDGTSGNGSHIINRFDAGTSSWSRLSDKVLLDGEDLRNAYPYGPVVGGDGKFHMCWVWRQTPDAETTHRLCYAQSRDLLTWETGLGQPLDIPIRFDQGDIVDDVPMGGGIINNNNLIGFDHQRRPLITYHKYDADGHTQLHIARLDPWGWTIRQLTSWSERWNFHGRGSLQFAITLLPPYVFQDSWIVQEYHHWCHGRGSLILDMQSLEVLADLPGSLLFPVGLEASSEGDQGLSEGDQGMKTNVSLNWNDVVGEDDFSCLTWKSRAENGDMPSGLLPGAAGMLELMHVRKARLGRMAEPARSRAEMPPARFNPVSRLMNRLPARQAALEARLKVEAMRAQKLEERIRQMRDRKE